MQQDFGGRVEPASPSTSLLSFAASVMTHVPDTCLYARVDVVESSRGPLLMELELIEPELYFLFVPEAAPRMARSIADDCRKIYACGLALPFRSAVPAAGSRMRMLATSNGPPCATPAGRDRQGAVDITEWTYDDLDKMRQLLETLVDAPTKRLRAWAGGFAAQTQRHGRDSRDAKSRAARISIVSTASRRSAYRCRVARTSAARHAVEPQRTPREDQQFRRPL